MPDPLNPESLRRAAVALWRATSDEAFPTGTMTGISVTSAALDTIRAYLATDPLRDAIGDLLHMHRQGVVSAEMWERVAAAFDGAKP